ncbi:oxygenase MpaB family protein [Pedobacter rhizosphaerae]|uniref:ER-bound oxygenase mpaB/mpaB'/Rubber oxygenase catalytic domain-containing protein n=1 Tax=Pedobacter rhizosphaerae TaxID=390241 RepID=A0A1H9U141_9SPHI|nr:oxygenase MpaB family protein [Pedobacter rhizosphaerae]SES03089.1 hypothetical protein SAMN04488023_12632 [Pedobacter rhizosphaerae]
MDFVKKGSIVREIWGNTDIILFIFAGAAAEFSLNRAVDWLYFTGKLPKDPLGRLFSTVAYAQKIVFSTSEEAHAAIDQITMIHKHVEAARSTQIPDWAYRDVLFMLIEYSIRSFEVLERKLSSAEKEEIFDTFYRMGQRMQITGLPQNFSAWQIQHAQQLAENLAYSPLSKDLFRQYKKHLGTARYFLMREIQALIVPSKVNHLLQLGKGKLIIPILWTYKMSRSFHMHKAIRNLILPSKYKAQILSLGTV